MAVVNEKVGHDHLSSLPMELVLSVFDCLVEGADLHPCLKPSCRHPSHNHVSESLACSVYQADLIRALSTSHHALPSIYIFGYQNTRHGSIKLPEAWLSSLAFTSKKLSRAWLRFLHIAKFRSLAVNIYDLPFLVPSIPHWLMIQMQCSGYMQLITKDGIRGGLLRKTLPAEKFSDILPSDLLLKLGLEVASEGSGSTAQATSVSNETRLLSQIKYCTRRILQSFMSELSTVHNAETQEPRPCNPLYRQWFCAFNKGHFEAFKKCSFATLSLNQQREEAVRIAHPTRSLLICYYDEPEKSKCYSKDLRMCLDCIP